MKDTKAPLFPEGFYGKAPELADGVVADPKDVCSIDAVVTAMYESISGPAGQKRQWDRLRSLMAPGAVSIRVGRLQDGTTGYRAMTAQEYIDQAGTWLMEQGFFEREIHRVIDRFGDIAHVFSTYESLRTPDDQEPFMRGINSIQLMFDGRRWWILSAFWQHEGPGAPIPRKYLPHKR